MTEDIQKWEGRHPATKTLSLVESSPAAMMQIALSSGVDIDKLEKMLLLQQKWEANEARKAFYEAVATFKENPPEVLKDKENSQFSKGDKKAMYVSLGNLLKTVNPALGKQGLSVSFEISQAEKLVTVSCKLSHRMGHSEMVTMTAPPDVSGGNAKNPIQQIKSTITYLRAATFEAVTGLAATDDANIDDDGNSAGNDEMTKFEEWEIKCQEAMDAAKTLEDMIQWWPDSGPTIKKELPKNQASKIYDMFVARKKELTGAEREPGEEG